MASTSTGSCLCQAAKYQLTGDPQIQAVCHCESCQTVSGSAFMANCIFDAKHFEVIQGQGSIKTYNDQATTSGNPLKRSFCGTCGSTLFVRAKGTDGGDIVAVSSGTKDHRDHLHPEYEFFCRNRRSWLPAEGIPGAKQLETQ